MLENKKAIMFLGPPGSGKGTQAKLLAEKIGFFHFITSAAGKEYIATHDDPETKKQLENYKAGILFDPPWLVDRVLKEKTEEIFQNYPGIIYDGSPRTLFESKELYAFLVDLIGKKNIFVVEIAVSENELKNRLSKRLICDKKSSHVFIRSEKLNPGDKCPDCDGILAERDLDNPKLFSTRISEYQNRTVPGLNFLKENHIVITINGERTIEAVFEDVVKNIETEFSK